jgi:tetratricopeptide (TPR) repeat protein
MKLSEIAESREICDKLLENGNLMDEITAGLENITPENEKDEILNIVKIANRVVGFGSDYDMPRFEQGILAASILKLTFSMDSVSTVPFMNAAAYLTNMSEYSEVIKVCLSGLGRFPDSIELLNKALGAAEALGDRETLEKLNKRKSELVSSSPDAVADESSALMMNWKTEEAKELIYRSLDSGMKPVPKIYSNLFFIYNQGFKDERTESIAEEVFGLIKSDAKEFVSDAELVYYACIYFVTAGNWQDSEKILNKYTEGGYTLTPAIIYEMLSTAIISKDTAKMEAALEVFFEFYNKDNTYFDACNYAFANVSHCYALLKNADKSIEYLNTAVAKGWNISYVKDMEDYSFIAKDERFTRLF